MLAFNWPFTYFFLHLVSNLLACLSAVNNFKVSPEFQLFCHWFSFYVQHSTKEIHLSLPDMYAWPSLYLCTHSTIVPAFFDMIQIFPQQRAGNSSSILVVIEDLCRNGPTHIEIQDPLILLYARPQIWHTVWFAKSSQTLCSLGCGWWLMLICYERIILLTGW